MPIDLEILTGVPPPGWDDQVCRSGGTVYHSSIWAEYICRDNGGIPIFGILRDTDGEIRAGGVAIFRKSMKPIASFVFRTMTLPAHPFNPSEQNRHSADFIGGMEDLARRLRCSRIELESNMSGDSPFVPSENGYIEIPRVEFVADLTQETDEIWKKLPKDQRERIRSLQRKGVRIEKGHSLDDLHGLRAVRESTRDRREQQGHGYSLPQNDEFYEDIYTHLIKRGAGHLFIARLEGEIIAALFFAAFNKKSNSVFSGSTPTGYKLGAQSGLFWTAVEYFKAEGFIELNRGGVPATAEHESDPQHGIYVYKSRLTTVPVRCRSGYKVIGPWRERITRLRDRLEST